MTIRRIILKLLYKYAGFIPDKTYVRWVYYLKIGKKLNLKNPQTFNEKLQWLKLYDRRPEYTQMVDKYAVKQYVASLIGDEYVIPTLGVWDNPEDIKWDNLPDKFVLKTTHGGGSSGVIICKDKQSFNRQKAIEKLKQSLKQDLYSKLRERPYKQVPRRILAEKYMETLPESNDLHDYKLFCFNGVVKCFKIDFDRQTDHHANYYDRQCNLLPFGEKRFLPQPEKKLEIPINLERMIQLAETLAKDIDFVRVDFYNLKGKIYFGEITFFPASGVGKFEPEEWDIILGSWLKLPSNIN